MTIKLMLSRLLIRVPGTSMYFSSRAIGIINFEKIFSKFYRRHYQLISNFNVGLKTLLREGLSEPEFYGDLVYKFKKLIGRNDFSFQFRKITKRCKRIGYSLNVMRQSDNYARFFNCT